MPSTPSSKKPFKENATEENMNTKGGAVRGPCGPRQTVGERRRRRSRHRQWTEATSAPSAAYPSLSRRRQAGRSSTATPGEPKKILYRLHNRLCPICKKRFAARVPVVPRSLYGNTITTQAAVMHYFHGIPMGRVCEMTGITIGSLVDMFHRLGKALRAPPWRC